VDQYAGSPGRSTYCYAELTASFINFLHYCLPLAPPGFCNRGEVRYGSLGGLEYEVRQKLTHLLQCIGNIFGRPPIGGKLPPPPSGGATVACHLLHFMVQMADALTIRLDATPSGLSVPPPPLSAHFYTERPFCRNPPNLSRLGKGTK